MGTFGDSAYVKDYALDELGERVVAGCQCLLSSRRAYTHSSSLRFLIPKIFQKFMLLFSE